MDSISVTTSSPGLTLDKALGCAGQDEVAGLKGHEAVKCSIRKGMSKTMSRVYPC